MNLTDYQWRAVWDAYRLLSRLIENSGRAGRLPNVVQTVLTDPEASKTLAELLDREKF